MGERALSVGEFCRAYGIGRATYYRQHKLGQMPKTVRVGRRVLLTVAACEEWRVAMESADTSET